MVKFDEVGAGGVAGGKSVKKSSKVEELSKTPESLKDQKYLQKLSVRRNAEPRSSFDTTSRAIIVMARLTEPLMFCHVFPPEEPR